MELVILPLNPGDPAMTSRSLAVVVLCAVLTALYGDARGQDCNLTSIDMEAVTARLGERFEEIRKYGLGAEDLQVRHMVCVCVRSLH